MRKNSEDIYPYSVLNTHSATWKKHRLSWDTYGFDGTDGRNDILECCFTSFDEDRYISEFDPVIAEMSYKWFLKDGGRILDPFCGGCTRGYVASVMGHEYVGIDIRQEQIDSNVSQCSGLKIKPSYICGDSEDVIRKDRSMYDMVFTCPPYYDLEVYSSLDEDLSNKPTYEAFLEKYESIIGICCRHLRVGCYAIFIVSDIRDEKGYYRGLVKDTIDIFLKKGMKLCNECIIVHPNEQASMRLGSFGATRKMVRVHQNMLVFGKEIHNADKVRKRIEKMCSATGADPERMFDEYSRITRWIQ